MTPTSPIALSAAARQQSAERSMLVSVDVNCLLSAGQIAAGLWLHSQGLVADGLHTLPDLIADGIVFITNRDNRKGPNEDHQCGHVHYENAASLGPGLLLIAAGAGMIRAAVESLRSPQGPAPVHGPALVVALIMLAAEEGPFRYMLAMAKRISSRVLIANAWYARSDVVSSLVAAVGVVGNLMDYYWLDPVVACVVGLMTGQVDVRFEWEAFNDLMGHVLPPAQVEAIRASLEATSGAMNVHDSRACVAGDQVLVDAHIEVDSRVSVSEGHATAAWARINVLTAYTAMAMLDVQIHVDSHEHIAIDPVPLPDCDALHTVLVQLLPSGTSLDACHCVLHHIDGAAEVDLVLPPTLAGELVHITNVVNARWDGLVRSRVLVTDA